VRDVRVVERGEDLPLVAEALEDELGVHAALDELDGDALVVLVVGADGQVDRPHAAAPYFAHHAVSADAAARHRRLVLDLDADLLGDGAADACDLPHVEGGRGDEGPGLLVVAQEVLDLLAQPGVPSAHVGQEFAALVLRDVERPPEYFFD
jgi:hypothetical protein